MTPERLDQLARRLVLDIMLEAQEGYWLRRAEDFAKVGTPSCDEIAKACRARATLCREDEREWAEMLSRELGEVA